MVATQSRSYWKDGVHNFYDGQLNPAFRFGVWANCPIQAIMADSQLGTIFYDDFFHFGNTGDIWTIVEDGGDAGGTDAIQDAAGGWYKHYCDGDNDDEAYIATAGESWKLDEDKPLWFEIGIKWTNSTSTVGNFICGLFEGGGDANSLVDSEGGPPADYDGVTFSKTSGTAVIAFETSIGNVPVTADLTDAFVSGTAYRLGFYWDGVGTVTPYLDGVAGTAHTMAATGLECNAVAGGVKSTGTSEEYFEVDFIKIVQLR